jgi:UDP:flavonoid glycosyltransferase YjiC (YdhE family)
MSLASELISRGYNLILAAPAPFKEMASSAGIPFYGLGTKHSYEESLKELDLWHPVRGVSALFSHVSLATHQTYEWLSQQALTQDVLVVASSLSLGARIAQDKLGLRVVTVHASPLLLESRYDSPMLPGGWMRWLTSHRLRHWIGRGAEHLVIGPAALPELNALRSRLKLPAVKRLRHWWNSPNRVVLLFPAWFAPPQSDWLSQAIQVGFPLLKRNRSTEHLQANVSSFLKDGPAPLVFTYGTAMRHGRLFFETAIAVCRRMNRRGILLTAATDQIPSNLPADIIHSTYAPLGLLLPHSAALIHHGGIGTLAQALAAGTPQLIVPLAFDQFDNGDRVRRLGVGSILSAKRLTPARAARHLNHIMGSPQVAQRCREVSNLMVLEAGVDVACDSIEAAINGH